MHCLGVRRNRKREREERNKNWPVTTLFIPSALKLGFMQPHENWVFAFKKGYQTPNPDTNYNVIKGTCKVEKAPFSAELRQFPIYLGDSRILRFPRLHQPCSIKPPSSLMCPTRPKIRQDSALCGAGPLARHLPAQNGAWLLAQCTHSAFRCHD